jgi:hypothetical protein
MAGWSADRSMAAADARQSESAHGGVMQSSAAAA